MAYTNNPKMPRVRRDAVELVRKGWSIRKVAKHYGYHHTTVMRWVEKSKKIGYHPIPTKSSRPKHHPNEIEEKIVRRILELREEKGRTYEVIHHQLKQEEINICATTVYNILDRHGRLKKRSPWKRYHPPVPRPNVEKPGDLVQLDTIHLMTGPKSRIYAMTLIDVHSRWVYAKCYEKLNSRVAVDFLNEAEQQSVFDFKMIQTDHGAEFGKWFAERTKRFHRYTRIGKPNDNAHIERFNRTLQEECLDLLPRKVRLINSQLKEYLRYYNHERLHMGIEFQTPVQLLARWCKAS